MKTTHVLFISFVLLVLNGCPYDRMFAPRLENNLDSFVQMSVYLTDGTVITDEVGLPPGVGMVWGYPPERIARIRLTVDGQLIEEIDSEQLDEMLNCTADPRDVTWHIEAQGLRPSVPCRQAARGNNM